MNILPVLIGLGLAVQAAADTPICPRECQNGKVCQNTDRGPRCVSAPPVATVADTTRPPLRACNLDCIIGFVCIVTAQGPRCVPGPTTPPAPTTETTAPSLMCRPPCRGDSRCQVTPQGPKCVSATTTSTPAPTTPTTPSTPARRTTATTAPPNVCTRRCPRGQICQFNRQGGQDCIQISVATTTEAECTRDCPKGRHCEIDDNGRERCVKDVEVTTESQCTRECKTGRHCEIDDNGRERCVKNQETTVAITTTEAPCDRQCPRRHHCVMDSRGNEQCVLDDQASPQCILPCPFGYHCEIGLFGFKRCVPTPPICGDNEEVNSCGNLCENKCEFVNQSGPRPCPLVCAPRACACSDGYFRNSRTNKCVDPTECPGYIPTTTLSPCALILCRPPRRCVVINGKGVCRRGHGPFGDNDD